MQRIFRSVGWVSLGLLLSCGQRPAESPGGALGEQVAGEDLESIVKSAQCEFTQSSPLKLTCKDRSAETITHLRKYRDACQQALGRSGLSSEERVLLREKLKLINEFLDQIQSPPGGKPGESPNPGGNSGGGGGNPGGGEPTKPGEPDPSLPKIQKVQRDKDIRIGQTLENELEDLNIIYKHRKKAKPGKYEKGDIYIDFYEVSNQWSVPGRYTKEEIIELVNERLGVLDHFSKWLASYLAVYGKGPYFLISEDSRGTVTQMSDPEKKTQAQKQAWTDQVIVYLNRWKGSSGATLGFSFYKVFQVSYVVPII